MVRLFSGGRLGKAMVAAAAVAACSVGQLGASDANLAKARSTAARGSDVYARECAGCHGQRGEGTASAPAVLGAGALPVYPSDQDRASRGAFSDPQTLEEEARARPAGAPSRDPFRTAEDLQRYVSERMPRPKEKVGSLPADDYWAVVNFLLTAHGSSVPEGGVNASNAATVEVSP